MYTHYTGGRQGHAVPTHTKQFFNVKLYALGIFFSLFTACSTKASNCSFAVVAAMVVATTAI